MCNVQRVYRVCKQIIQTIAFTSDYTLRTDALHLLTLLISEISHKFDCFPFSSQPEIMENLVSFVSSFPFCLFIYLLFIFLVSSLSNINLS